MSNRYYQDELAYLRELGREFVGANPHAAPFLDVPGRDPDVERLLEGFAFLSGRIREKLDDELPEFTHAMVEMLWPHYLRPIPATSVVQFEPLPQAAKETRTVSRGTLLDAAPVDGTACRFATTSDVVLQPVQIERVELKLEVPPTLLVRLRCNEGVTLAQAGIDRLRLFFAGESAVTRGLVLGLSRLLREASVHALDGSRSKTRVPLPAGCVQSLGFRPEESLWPVRPATFEGFRLLHEYFAFPGKFSFLELTGLQVLAALGDARTFELEFQFARLPDGMPPLGTGTILLHCTPVVNLFAGDVDPVAVDRGRTEYLLRPAGANPKHAEVHTVTRVVGRLEGGAGEREYEPFFRFRHALTTEGRDAFFYRAQVRQSVAGHDDNGSTETWLSVSTPETEAAAAIGEVLSVEALCTNRGLPARLKPGDIRMSTANSPVFARFKNVTQVLPAVPPPLGTDLYWRLIAHQSLHYVSLTRLDALRTVLGLYNFRILVDRQAEQTHRLLLDGIKDVRARPATRFLGGLPVRGLAIEVELDQANFAGEGDLYLFATLLDRFFAAYVTLNSFSQLTVHNTRRKAVFEFAPRFEGSEPS